ncbi:creatininase family protein [Sphingomonas sp. MAH-20]|uniref:Creatininase family protein n=1 Tax=Sphingomonas horti TaxID=2682842 RepID=A0A6I4J622_9SPHN|nr:MULTISPECIES: creatininase family protein [Sphingomonas]MBA2919621.1 creatininase family protein [Sphingomonas sp. CGMCC 1.13658]MVO78501.1 creatininase family protein [Sphingomonas horti]
MRLGDAPWTAVRDALASGAPVAAILPLGAVEAHGPHLPLITDVVISDGMAARTAAMLEGQGVRAFVLPALAYAPAGYASEFAGTISIGAAAGRAVLIDIARSLKEQGFACLAFANSHFDPENVAMLREAAAEVAALGLPVAFPDFTRRALAATLTEEFQSGACHAGQFETSLVLADRPELVDAAGGKVLADNPSSLVTAFAQGATTFAEAGGPDAYFGSPSNASAAEGARSYDIMAAALAETILACLR